VKFLVGRQPIGVSPPPLQLGLTNVPNDCAMESRTAMSEATIDEASDEQQRRGLGLG